MGFISELLGEEEPRQPYARPRGKFLFYRRACLSGDTEIVMADRSIKKISEIQVGEEIIAGDNKPAKVLYVLKKESSSPLIKIKPFLLPPLTLTEDHLVKVIRFNWKCTREKLRRDQPNWVEAKDVKPKSKAGFNRYKMIYPIPTDVIPVDLNEEQLKLIGYFVAEGHYSGHWKILAGASQYVHDSIGFTLHEEESDFADDIMRYSKHLFNAKSKNTVVTDKRTGSEYRTVVVHSPKMVDFIKTWVHGKNATGKFLDEKLILMENVKQETLMNAMMRGDGKKEMIVYSTASRLLAHQVQLILFRANNLAGIIPVLSGKTGVAPNHLCYNVVYYPEAKCRKSQINDGYLYTSICWSKKIETQETVYDLTLDRLPQITTVSGVVHNCPYCAISLAALEDIESTEPLAHDPDRKVRLIDVDLDREMTLWLSNILERKNGNGEVHIPVLYIDGLIKEGIIANPAAFKLNDKRDVYSYEVTLRQWLRLPQRGG
jgi:glutaredoxin